jgi:tetratricopeptide (TPR) repeat protein
MKQPVRVLALLGGLVGLFVFLLTDSMLSQSTRPGEDSYVRGLTLANNYECVRAIEEFDRAVNANPQDPRYLTSRANCRMRELSNSSANAKVEAESTEIIVAINDLTDAIKADPNYAAAYFERGSIKSRLVRAGKAYQDSVLNDYDRAVELEPGNTEFLAARAQFLLYDAKDEKRGLEDLELLLKLEPEVSEHLVERGLFFAKMGRLQRAIDDFSGALKLDPNDFITRSYRAHAYFETENYSAALADTNYLLKDPKVTSVSTLELRAKVYRALGKTKLAEADETKAKREREETEAELEQLQKMLNPTRKKPI